MPRSHAQPLYNLRNLLKPQKPLKSLQPIHNLSTTYPNQTSETSRTSTTSETILTHNSFFRIFYLYYILPLMKEAEVAEPPFICVRSDETVSHIRDRDMTSQPHSPQPQGEVQPQKPPLTLTQLERARLILQSGKISFDPKLHLFNVLGSGDWPYVVHLSP